MEKDRIREVKETLNEAIRRRNVHDTESVFAEKTVMFVLAPPLQFVTGENAPGANGIQEWFDTFDGDIDISYDYFKVHVDGNIAFSHCLEHLRGRRTDGSETDIWYRETLGLKKSDGEWKIIHQHQSVPFYMDGSNLAALDLKP